LQLQEFRRTKFGHIPNEWETGQLNSFLIENPKNGITKEVASFGSGYEIVEINSLYQSNFFLTINNLRKVPLDCRELENYRLLNNDFLINRVSKLKEGAGKLVLVKEPPDNLVYEGNLIRIRINQHKIIPEFLEYFSKSNIYFNYMQSVCKTLALTSIDQNVIYNIPVILPPLKEQQKIATILSKVDELIQKIDQIIEQTRRLKKGLMQRLLIKGIGHSKFKNVKSFFGKNERIPINWNIVNLGEIARIRYGMSQPPEEDVKGIQMIRATDIKRGRINRENLLRVKPPDTKKDVLLHTGDIIVVRSGVNTGDIGYIPKEFEGCLAGYDLFVTPNKDIDSLFLLYYLLSPRIQDYFSQLKSRVAQEHLNSQQLSQAIIYLPSYEEQKKISFCIMNVDNLIQSYVNYKQKMDGLKKGLMQQLLTGKIRVRV
jgi:type I restriction enzyme, S subunit